jgi:hypothetical protein
MSPAGNLQKEINFIGTYCKIGGFDRIEAGRTLEAVRWHHSVGEIGPGSIGPSGRDVWKMGQRQAYRR